MTFINLPKKRTQTKFQYYIHASICYLRANLEHLKLFIANPDHTFDIIGVLETKTPKINQNIQSIKEYQTYYDTKGNSLKSKCVFFLKRT